MADRQRPRNENQTLEPPNAHAKDAGEKKLKFEPPKVITYSGDDILEELGPAHACSPFSGAVVSC